MSVTYTQSDSYYAKCSFDGGYSGDWWGPGEFVMSAHDAPNKRIAAFRTFKTGGANTGSNRALQCGDRFIISVYGYSPRGILGCSINDGASTSTWADRISNSRGYVQCGNSYGDLYVTYGSGSTASWSGVKPNNSTVSVVFDIVSSAEFNANTVNGSGSWQTIKCGLQMMNSPGASDKVDGYSVYYNDDYNGSVNHNVAWKTTTSVENRGVIELGTANSTYTVNGVISDGLAANSTSTVSSNQVQKQGSGTVTLANTNNSYAGGTLIGGDNGAIAITADGCLGDVPSPAATNVILKDWATLKCLSNMTLNANRRIAISNGIIEVVSARTVSYGGILSGAGEFSKKGTGTLSLSGANSFTNCSYIDAGTLQLSGSDPLDSAWINVGPSSAASGARLLLGASGVTVDGQVCVRAASSENVLAASASGTDTFSAGIKLDNSVTISNVTGNTLTFSGALWQNGGDRTVTKKGAGTVVLSGGNSIKYLNIEAGMVQQGSADNRLPSWCVVDVDSGATLDLNGRHLTIESLAGAGSVDVGSAGYYLTIGNGGAGTEFSGVISGAGNFSKAGSGIQILSGQNTYSGATYVDAGELRLNNTTDPLDTSRIYLGKDSGTDNATLGIGLAGGRCLEAITVRSGSSGTKYIAANNTSGSALFSGTISLSDAVTLTADSGGDLSCSGSVNLNANTLTVQGGNNTTFGTSTPSVQGTGGCIVKNGSGKLTFPASAYYTGTTTLNDGETEVSGSCASSAFTVGGAALLTGDGAVNTLAISGRISPNTGADTETTFVSSGDITLNAGGIFDCNLSALPASGTAGTDWDLLRSSSGALKANATGTFTVRIYGSLPGFVDTLSYSWKIMEGNSSVTDFSTTRFSVTDNLTSPASVTGTWSIEQSGNDIHLVYTAVGGSDAPIWNGGAGATDMAYSTDSNWDSTHPDDEAQISFAGSTSLFPTNDYAEGSQFRSIWFTNSSSSFVLRGNACHVRDKIENQSLAEQTIDMDITFNGDGAAEVNPVNDDLVLNGDVYLETNLTMLIWGDNQKSVTFNGSILEGAGSSTGAGVWLRQDSTVIFNSVNNYFGATTLTNGTLRLGIDNAISSGSDLVVSNSATFDMDGYNTSVESLAGDGTVTMGDGELRIAGVRQTTFGGVISGAGKLIHNGEGQLTLSGNNTYSGGTVVSGGIIKVSSDVNLGTVPASAEENIVIGNWKLLQFLDTMTLDAKRSVTMENGHLLVDSGKEVWYGGEISGKGQFNKAGDGRLNLSGASTYTNVTELQGGILAIGADNNLGEPPAVGPAVSNLFRLNGDWASSALWITNNLVLDRYRGFMLAQDSKIHVTDGATGTYSGVIAQEAASTDLAKTGPGTLRLSGNSTFDGHVYLDEGMLWLEGSGPLDAAYVDVGDDISSDSPAATLAFGSMGPISSTIHIRTNANDLTTGKRMIYGGGSSAYIYGGIVLSDEVTIYSVTNDNLKVYSVISEARAGRSVTKDGPGKVELHRANTFTGNLYLNGGEVLVTNASPLDAWWIDIGETNSATSTAWAQFSLGPDVVIDRPIHVRTNIAKQNETRRIAMYPAGAAEISSTVTLSDHLEVGVWPGGSLTFSGLVSQDSYTNQRITKVWGGTMILEQENDFKWLNVNEGVVRSGIADALPFYNELYLLEGTTYEMDDYDLLIQLVSGNGTIDLGSVGTTTLSISMAYDVNALTRITGAGNLTKTGFGEDKYFYGLKGTNDYGGLTKVCHGSLKIYESTNISGGLIAIETNATLWAADDLTLDASRTITLTDAGQIRVDPSFTMQVNSAIEGDTLSKMGEGELLLTGVSTFTDELYINQGTISVTAANPLGCTVIELGPDAEAWDVTLDIGAGSTIDEPITVNADSEANTKTIQNTSAGAATVSGLITMEAGVQLNLANSGGGSLTLDDVHNNDKSYFSVDAGSVEVAGTISNGGGDGIDKLGPGTLELTGSSTYDGGTYIVGGTLKLNNTVGNTLDGSPTIYIGNISGNLESVLEIPVGVTVTNRIQSRPKPPSDAGTNIISKTGDGDVTISGPLDIFYATTEMNTFEISESGTGKLIFNAGWNLGATQRVAVIEGDVKVVTVGITNATPANGFDGLVKRGDGTLEIDSELGVNFYQDQGNVIIGPSCTFVDVDTYYLGTRDNADYTANDTYLTFQQAQSFTNALTVGTLGGDTGIRQINFDHVAGSVDISGDIVLGEHADRFLILSNDSAQVELSGDISGTGGLIKQGAGTVVFSANATYEDETKVEEGMLLLNDIVNTAVLSISNGAVLKGQGTVGALDVYGSLGPGRTNAVGTLNAVDATFRASSTLDIGLSSCANSKLELTGNLTFADGQAITLNLTNIANANLLYNMVIITYDGSSVGSPEWSITSEDFSGEQLGMLSVTNDADLKQWYIAGATPDCNITNGSPDMAEDNKVELEVQTLAGLSYDLIFVDAVNYSDSLSNSWEFADRLVATSDTLTFTNDLSTLNSSCLRFLRVSPMGGWSNAIGRYASEQVYVAKRVQLFPGRNWVSLPCIPANPTVSNVFAYSLPAGAAANATRIYLYDVDSSISPTSEIWLTSGDHWQWEDGGSGDADDFLLPIEQGFMVDLPGSTSAEFPAVGALRVADAAVTVKGHGTMNFLSVSLPANMHPKDLNLYNAGFRGASRAMLGDRIYVWDASAAQLKQNGWMWYNTRQGAWYYDNNRAIPTTSRPIGQNDAILIYTFEDSDDWVWTNNIYYTPPTKYMQP